MNGIQSSNPIHFFALAIFLVVSIACSANYTLQFIVDRSKLPYLNNNELTLKVNACGATSASVIGDETQIASSIVNGNVVFTTDASDIAVFLVGATTTTGLGQFTKAVLKHDCYWPGLSA